MTSEQLELMIARTGYDHLRRSTSDSNPNAQERESIREWVRQASAVSPWPELPLSPEPEPPSLVTKAGNLARAAVTFVASGCEVVDRAEYDRRRAICEACRPYFDAASESCKLCGCNLKVKPWGKAMECPDGRW